MEKKEKDEEKLFEKFLSACMIVLREKKREKRINKVYLLYIYEFLFL